MIRRNARNILILSSMAAIAAGCESGTGPEDEATFDAEAVLADFEAMDLILQSEAMNGFRALGAGVSFQGMASGEWFAAPIISQFRRGKTFAYDPGLGRYVIDDDLSGAPETGVRFLLYRAGPDGKPDPANQVGHADLIDEGDGSVEDIALWLVVVESADTVLSYRTTLDILEKAGVITVAGSLQGEDDRLNFDITVLGSAEAEANTVDIGFKIWLQEKPLAIEGTVSGMESGSGEGGEIDLLVEHGENSFQVQATGTDDSIDGIVKLNGEGFALISGDPAEPSITNADGEPLTWVEVMVLRRILDSIEDVFDLWEDLMDPVDELVILALIL